MSVAAFDRVQQTGTANTTVSFTLSGTTAAYQSFAVVGNGNTTYYAATDGTNWEVGIGTYSTTGPTLTRTTILSSSNSNSAVTFSGGVTIWIDLPASAAVTQTDVGSAPNQVPLNQYLGSMAYQDKAGVNITGGFVSTQLAPTQPTPTALTASATLTTAQIQTQIIQVTSATGVTLTMPTGTVIDGAIVPVIPLNSAIDFWIINTGSVLGAVTVAVATGVTNIGGLSVAISTSAYFRLVRTAINTYILYRLA